MSAKKVVPATVTKPGKERKKETAAPVKLPKPPKRREEKPKPPAKKPAKVVESEQPVREKGGQAKYERKIVRGVTVEIGRGPRGGMRYNIFGYSCTSVFRWMGKDGWKFQQVLTTLDALGLKDIAYTTISSQMASGARDDGGKRGRIIDLTDHQASLLRKLRKPIPPSS